MSGNPHQDTLLRFVDLHQADLADLHRQARRLREMLRRRPPWPEPPKPPLSREALSGDLAGVERRITKHERLVELARDARVGEVLRAVADDPDLAREAAADPSAFAAGHGIDLPDTLVVTVLVAGRDVSARFSNPDPDMPFEVAWTRDGFQAPPVPDVRRGRAAAEPV
ncbi:hypothetical protein [Streptomyces spectabilis]|uniref:Uncharacterized protein n=1 Tax=Streptomyces spectabilis TaxID=68270 RepID=A0A5P2XLB8_STRST|nr:hypothetical protein [Streptomyces spectabilis]MBB5102109.1 hypothetical protein [Streptomyces spectabilis]MCI3907159.1 hypothetical protein [Streptomyces spectabilis]QEV63915.1 hypothetical protein CP982_38780 [Streptomyces spectabilis]